MRQILLCSHPAARLLAGCCLLAVAIFSQSLWLSTTLLLLSALLINLLESGWQSMIRMLRLLRWFVVPIILLHALLSPGQLLLPSTPLPLTREGLLQGLWLSIHFITLFVAAMLMFRLLLRSEWLRGMLSVPLVGRYLLAYLLMLAAMKKNIGEQLAHMRQQWSLRKDWQSAALFMLAAFRLALAAGREQAWMLWLRWPVNGEGMYLDVPADAPRARPRMVSSIAWVLLGLTALVLVRA